jgi:hypothetical protein
MMFMVAVVKKLAQNMGTSNSGLEKTAKSKICTNFQKSVITGENNVSMQPKNFCGARKCACNCVCKPGSSWKHKFLYDEIISHRESWEKLKWRE